MTPQKLFELGQTVWWVAFLLFVAGIVAGTIGNGLLNGVWRSVRDLVRSRSAKAKERKEETIAWLMVEPERRELNTANAALLTTAATGFYFMSLVALSLYIGTRTVNGHAFFAFMMATLLAVSFTFGASSLHSNNRDALARLVNQRIDEAEEEARQLANQEDSAHSPYTMTDRLEQHYADEHRQRILKSTQVSRRYPLD